MRVHATLIMLGVFFTAVGCYPEQINSISQLASVTTLVDSQAPLRNAQSFALPDTIVHVTMGAGVISHGGDQQMIAPRPLASVFSASTSAAAPLFTTSASSAPVRSRNNAAQCA